MPCVFGIIFISSVPRQVGLSENIFFFVNFQRKIQLLF